MSFGAAWLGTRLWKRRKSAGPERRGGMMMTDFWQNLLGRGRDDDDDDDDDANTPS
jgi:hypothetical protein